MNEDIFQSEDEDVVAEGHLSEVPPTLTKRGSRTKAKTTTSKEFKCDKCKASFDTVKSLIGHCNATGHKFPDKYKTKEKKKLQVIQRAAGVYDGRQYESVYYENRPAFLLGPKTNIHQSARELSGKPAFEIVYNIEDKSENVVIKPLRKHQAPYRPYALSKKYLNKVNKLKGYSTQEMYDLVYKEFDEFLYLSSDYKALETTQCLESYQCHRHMTTSYLAHVGEPESGKTTALDLHKWLSYRANLSLVPTAASIYRYLGYHDENACGTLCMDEMHKLDPKKHPEIYAILKSGYTVGASVQRTIEPTKKDTEQRFWKTFCCKIIAGEWMYDDEAFNQRCIEISMIEGDPKFDEFTKDDLVRFDKVKFKLLIWRMMTYFDPLPTLELPSDLELKKRQKQLWKPKMLTVIGTTAAPIIDKLCREDELKRIDERKASLKADVLRTLLGIAIDPVRPKEPIPFVDIWVILTTHWLDIEDTMIDKKASVTSPTGLFVSKFVLSKQLRTVFKGKVRNYKRKVCYTFDIETLMRIGRKYGVLSKEVIEVSQLTSRYTQELAVVVDKREEQQQQSIPSSNHETDLPDLPDGTPIKSLDEVFDDPSLREAFEVDEDEA